MTIDGLRFTQIRTRSMRAACTTTGLQRMVTTTTERVNMEAYIYSLHLAISLLLNTMLCCFVFDMFLTLFYE